MSEDDDRPTPPSERKAWEARYSDGPTPWDTRITPPEVLEFWRNRPVPVGARALDVGAGRGTNAAFLALRQLQTVALDIAGLALHQAATRLTYLPDPILRNIHLVQASASHLPLSSDHFYYILDIGCFHGLPVALRCDYANEIGRVCQEGGFVQIFAFDKRDEDDDRGMTKLEVKERFGMRFEIIHEIQGRPDRAPCRWYTLQKRGK